MTIFMSFWPHIMYLASYSVNVLAQIVDNLFLFFPSHRVVPINIRTHRKRLIGTTTMMALVVPGREAWTSILNSVEGFRTFFRPLVTASFFNNLNMGS